MPACRLPAALVLACLPLAAPAGEMPAPDGLLDAAAMADYIAGRSYAGSKPDSGEPVASVIYRTDGSSVLTMADGRVEPGSWRIEGNAYCTRYAAFRNNSENCFHLQPLDAGRTQAWYTDGRRALVLTPLE